LKATEQPFVHLTSIPEDRFFVNSRFFLAIQSETKAEKLIQSAPGLVKIASSGQIQSIINSAVAGVRIVRPTSIPRAIPTRVGYQYFQLELSGAYWQQIVRSRNLAIYVPEQIANPAMELVVLLDTEV
jgi:type VI secretion system protein ImpJ